VYRPNLTKEELEWIRSIHKQLKETDNFIDEWLRKDAFNMFGSLIHGLLSLNCKIVAREDHSDHLHLTFKCGEDTYIVARADEPPYKDHYRRLKKELDRLGYGGESQKISEVDLDQLYTRYFKIKLYLDIRGIIYVYMGEHIKLLRQLGIQAWLLGIRREWSKYIVFDVEIKSLLTQKHKVGYWISVEDEKSFVDEDNFHWPPFVHRAVLMAIYNKRSTIEERLHNALYIALKIPTIFSEFLFY